MTEMIDRIAKALMNHTAEIDHSESWDNASEAWRENYRGHARAAIAAMREPSEAMIAAGLNERDVNGTGARGLPLCFTRMIDAALAAVDEPDAPAAP